MPNISHLKLGKRAPRIDPRTLKLSKYIKALSPPPAQCGFINKVLSWPLFLNDFLGDCTVAAAGHMIEQWTTYAGKPFTPVDPQILTAYEAVSGYSPNVPSSDNGAVMLDVLNYWRKTGIAGHKIVAFVAVDPTKHDEIKQAVSLFGNCYIGVGLPVTAQNPIQGANGLPVWSMPPNGPIGDGQPWSWGGHCVPIVGYGADQRGNLGSEVVTWGQLYDMTWGFLDLYCDEAYAVLSRDWLESSGQSVSGFDLAQLEADLNEVTA